uniref:Superoxide dismutase copper/zinc binding domain-containing protein n=1 Tax=Timema poppense TaxID=170557 RepID=A0A7R9CUI6_TIMPO|nr:unnamed protein product [Timema poppensis]
MDRRAQRMRRKVLLDKQNPSDRRADISRGLQLTAYLSENGLHGTVSFEHQPDNVVVIKTNLQATDEESQWMWSVAQLPVKYDKLQDRCGGGKLGAVVYKLDDKFGALTLPSNGSNEYKTSDDDFPLTGDKGLWGKSLILETTDGSRRTACGTITVSGKGDEKVAEARFFAPVAGSVFFRWVGSHQSDSSDTLIYTDLYHVSNSSDTTQHNWKIYTTDILDSEADKSRENCNLLQVLYDPVSSGADQKGVGDLDSRLGQIQVSGSPHTSTVAVYHDLVLTSLSVDLLNGPRSLYLVIFDQKHDDSFFACARIREGPPVTLKALINTDGIKGDVTLVQRSLFDPTWLQMNLSSAQDVQAGQPVTKLAAYKVHNLPPLPNSMQTDEYCSTTGGMYNPTDISAEQASGSQDSYATGDLNGKHNIWRKEQTLKEVNSKYWDVFLPLQGHYSVAHRSIVLYRSVKNTTTSMDTPVPWVCGTLAHYTSGAHSWKLPMFTTLVVFRYPIVGRIVFRQPSEQPWADTTIIIEYLIHADGTSQNNTIDHRWGIHDSPPGKDFYDWQNRCISAGNTYDPYKILFDPKESESICSSSKSYFCRVGDLSSRHGTLNIAGRKGNSSVLSRRLFTDTQLPLSGLASVVGKSVVLYDDNGPKARGERLACSAIGGEYRRKAVVKDWFGNGELTPLKGKIEFFQQTEYDVTDMEVELEGLEDNSGYHVHITPIEANLDFPCEESTLYGHWNPLAVNPNLSPRPGESTSDQYEMGDLSGKFGTLENLTALNAVYNDTRLPLFGNNAILGRSVVIHKRERNARWACSTIERGYAPSEARELRGIASFHHPLGFAYGYIRMTQLVYNDKSMSDTVLEVKLRHPGKNDRNVTRNHNWAIYVNPVGVDASVQILNTRCVAGGYIWNPYYTQLADPLNVTIDELYREECGPDNPLRCYVGDVSGRMGTIDIGAKRQVFTDPNFPLEGVVSALGRSIVILNKDRRGERFACANIEPDYDIIKYANIRKPPKFVMAQFIDEVREVMGIPEWMLSVDTRKTKTLHNGGCIQFLLHFKGAVASQLEQDFSRLLTTGRLSSPSLKIHGYVPNAKRKSYLSYRPCGSRDPSDKNKSE